MDNNTGEDSFELNIDFKGILNKFRSNWRILLRWTLIGGVASCLFALTVPHKFTVVSKVAPELSLRSNSLTSLSSLASGLGMTSMLSGNNDAILPSVYPDIVASTPFLVDILESKVNADSTLYSYMKYDMPSFWLNKVLGFPGMLVSKVRDIFEEEEEDNIVSGVIKIDPYRLTRSQDAICKGLSKSIKVTVDKKSFLVTITVTLPDREVAASVSRLVVDNLKAYVTDYRTKKAIQNAEYLEKVTEEAHSEYMAAQNEYSEYLDRNQSILLKSNLVRGVDLQNRVSLHYQLYSSLTTELQQARTKVLQETPVFAEIIPPTVPTISSNSRKSIALALTFLVFCCAVVYVFVKKDKNSSK